MAIINFELDLGGLAELFESWRDRGEDNRE